MRQLRLSISYRCWPQTGITVCKLGHSLGFGSCWTRPVKLLGWFRTLDPATTPKPTARLVFPEREVNGQRNLEIPARSEPPRATCRVKQFTCSANIEAATTYSSCADLGRCRVKYYWPSWWPRGLAGWTGGPGERPVAEWFGAGGRMPDPGPARGMWNGWSRPAASSKHGIRAVVRVREEQSSYG